MAGNNLMETGDGKRDAKWILWGRSPCTGTATSRRAENLPTLPWHRDKVKQPCGDISFRVRAKDAALTEGSAIERGLTVPPPAAFMVRHVPCSTPLSESFLPPEIAVVLCNRQQSQGSFPFLCRLLHPAVLPSHLRASTEILWPNKYQP